MRVRRCTHLLLEPRETVSFGLQALLRGNTEANSTHVWLALAGHLDGPVEIDAGQSELLGRTSATQWRTLSAQDMADPRWGQLLSNGLLLGDQPEHADLLARDQRIKDAHWWPLSAVAHRHSRWQGVDSVSDMRGQGLDTAVGLRRTLGAPPPAVHPLEGQYQPLPNVQESPFDALLAARTTCRNFDPGRALPLPMLAQLLQRSVMAHAALQVEQDMLILKKNVPSGGGLHPTEVWLLVQRVDGLAPGLYHYHALDHALLALPSPPVPTLPSLARTMVSGQEWFADAPVLIVLAPRFGRSFWKYRNHAKAYRALTLDAGHISQMVYLAATEAGLGAFVTAAINEGDVDQAFGLDGVEQGALAICGVGYRAVERSTAEFDPAGRSAGNYPASKSTSTAPSPT
ncbi:putative peptide maturation dehydrogenase [Stenotrophomonas sp. JAG2]|uniref:putative peptide maturation dehydrogenase n=1 Tax=Stenotrophomonas sp. JAG2 TaxID=3229243 RepID=UPI0034E204CB